MSEIAEQVEYYLSDENLSQDKFFNGKISESKDGWLDLKYIQACRKIASLKVSDEQIADALVNSKKVEVSDDKKQVRRAGNKAVPELVERNEGLRRGHQPAFNRPVQIGQFRYPSLKIAISRAKEILRTRKEGSVLKAGTPDHTFVMDVLKNHPNFAAKAGDDLSAVQIKVDKSTKGDNKCFFIVKGESQEDISIIKAFQALEARLLEEQAASQKTKRPLPKADDVKASSPKNASSSPKNVSSSPKSGDNAASPKSLPSPKNVNAASPKSAKSSTLKSNAAASPKSESERTPKRQRN